MHDKLKQALEEIDTAVMNGDTFANPAAREMLWEYMDSWVASLEELAEESSEEEE